MIQKLIKKYTEILNTLEQNNSIKDSTDYYPYNIDINNTKEYLNDLKDLAINYTHSSLQLKGNEALSFDEWLSHFEKTEDNNYWLNKDVLYCKEAMRLHYDNLPDE